MSDTEKKDDKREMQQEDDPLVLVEFDDILPYLGDFGKYQKILFLLMIPFAFFLAFVYFSQIFMILVPEKFWCRVPELKDMSLDEKLELAIPIDEDGERSRCKEYDVNWSELLKQSEHPSLNKSWPQRQCSNGWEYSKDIPYDTISIELEWVCSKGSFPAIAQAMFFCGAICGGLLFGWMADKYGRIYALVGTNLVGFVAGISTSFCHSFWSFALCRFLVGLAFDNCFVMMYILVLEYISPVWRTFVANMSIALFFTFACCFLPWIAYFIADWRWYTIATSVPLILGLATPLVVPESARWLATQGKIEKAIVIIRKIEKINKAKIPEKVFKNFTDTCERIKREAEASGKTYSILELFKTPRLRATVLLLITIWVMMSICFDGHVRNVGGLGLDPFLTFSVAATTELPAALIVIVFLDRWGRRWMACGSMIFGGIFSLLASGVPQGIPTACLAMVGRMSVNISYNIGLQYAAELLPTVVRAQGVAFIHITGYVGSMLSPFIVYLGILHITLPLIILGVIGIVGGVLCLFLPETLNEDLPTTIQDGEDFGRGQKFWAMPCIGDKSSRVPRISSLTAVSSVLSVEKTSSFRLSGMQGVTGSRAHVRVNEKARKMEKLHQESNKSIL